jgi:YVTN family beta-propeller protein
MRKNVKLSICLWLSVLFGAGLPAVLDAAPFAYIPNSGGNTISIIDTATNGVVNTLAVGTTPYGVALLVKTSETFSFITNFGSNTVSVIRTSNDVSSNPVFKKVQDISVGRFPYGIAVEPTGTFAYVTNSGDGTVSKINLGTYETVAVIAVGSNPIGIAVSPDGTKVYVVNNSSGTVSIISAADNTVIGTVRVGTNPYGIAVHPQGTFIYVANSGDNSISVMKTADNSLITKSDLHFSIPSGVAVNPAGTVAYVTNFNSGSVSLFDTSTNAVSSPNILVEANPIGVSLSSDGLFTYVVNSGQGTVSVINNMTNTVSTKVTVGAGPYALGSFIAPLGKTVPTVTASIPVNGAGDVATDTIVQVTFSDMMDASSINSSTFLVSGSVTGTITYDSVTKTATFKPSKSLEKKMAYTVTLTTGIKNATGNALASNYTWSFTTSENDGSCFIATAVYGSYDDVNVQILRRFRDQHLLPHEWGAKLVDVYYRYSPSIADFIREHNSLRTPALWILTPVVYFVQYPSHLAWIFVLGLIIIIGRKKLKFLRI